jgi:VanZ family protein
MLVTAWCALAGIAIVTLSPLQMRPIVTADPTYERFAAFAVVGLLFAFAYPRRTALAAMIVVAAAIGLEAAQHLTPDRHGHLRDLLEKASGGLLGLLAGQIAVRFMPARIL